MTTPTMSPHCRKCSGCKHGKIRHIQADDLRDVAAIVDTIKHIQEERSKLFERTTRLRREALGLYREAQKKFPGLRMSI